MLITHWLFDRHILNMIQFEKWKMKFVMWKCYAIIFLQYFRYVSWLTYLFMVIDAYTFVNYYFSVCKVCTFGVILNTLDYLASWNPVSGSLAVAVWIDTNISIIW